MSMPPAGTSKNARASNHAFMSSGSATSSTSSSAMSETFTPQMRDRQARGKDPYQSGDGSDDGDFSDGESRTGGKLRLGNVRVERDEFAKFERRHKAIAFLDSPELLLMYAQSTGDSVPGARLHFTRILCGYDDEASEHTNRHAADSDSRRGHHQHPTDKRRGAFDHAAGTN